MEHGLGSHSWQRQQQQQQDTTQQQRVEGELAKDTRHRICTVNAVAGNEHVLMCAASKALGEKT